MAKTTIQKKSPLTLHRLLVELSYWGTSVRLLLAAFLLAVACIVTVAGTYDATSSAREVMMVIYVFGSLFVLDFGYVMTCRALPLRVALDRLVIILADILLVAFYVIPSVAIVNSSLLTLRNTSLIIAILVVAIRLLLGFLFTPTRRI